MPRAPTSAGRRPWWRRVLRAARWLPLAVVVGLAAVLGNACTAMGHRAVGTRLERMQRSPNWKDGHFVNPQPLQNDNWAAMTAMFHASDDATPRQPVPMGGNSAIAICGRYQRFGPTRSSSPTTTTTTSI